MVGSVVAGEPRGAGVVTTILQLNIKVYKYKVISTSFNVDIYGTEIIYLEERLHLLVNILAMGSLV
jgi:hypothetical protein